MPQYFTINQICSHSGALVAARILRAFPGNCEVLHNTSTHADEVSNFAARGSSFYIVILSYLTDLILVPGSLPVRGCCGLGTSTPQSKTAKQNASAVACGQHQPLFNAISRVLNKTQGTCMAQEHPTHWETPGHRNQTGGVRAPQVPALS